MVLKIMGSSPNSAVEFVFADGLADFDVFVGADGDVSVGVEFVGALGVDVSVSFLVFVGGELNNEGVTHLWASGTLESTILLEGR